MNSFKQIETTVVLNYTCMHIIQGPVGWYSDCQENAKELMSGFRFSASFSWIPVVLMLSVIISFSLLITKEHHTDSFKTN